MDNSALITGCGGFIGSHLADFLAPKLKVYGIVYKDTENVKHLKDKIEIINCDISDRIKIWEIVKQVKPDYVFHLAAQSYVAPSWKEPEETLRINILGTFYLLEGIREANTHPIIEVASSAAVYGLIYENEIPVNESAEFRPTNPYAVSKVATDALAYLYWQAYRMRIIRLRLFNIIGPRKTFDACADFARGIAEIEKGIKSRLDVGNLNSVRDPIDVRDATKAMWLLTKKGAFGDAYNICSGKGYVMSDILDRLISLSTKGITVCQAAEKLRPLDAPLSVGDNSKIRKLGWEPEIPIDEALKDILDYWRKVI